MDTRTIGSLEASVVGLGTNNFGFSMAADAVPPVVDATLDAGINFFDTSDSYNDSEDRLARALGRRRDEVIIATKFGNPVAGAKAGAAPSYLRSAVERSLQQLRTDRIDLYQLHRPDPLTPIADTLGVLDELVKEGKLREIGCSNFSAAQLREADEVATGAHFVSVQNQLNLLQRDDEGEALPVCAELGLAYLPFFPLASGLLTGKYVRGEPPAPGTRLEQWGERGAGALDSADFDVIEGLQRWAGDHGHALVDLAFAWLLAKPAVASVIAGATSVSQVRSNVAAGGWHLSTDEVGEVDAIAGPGS